MDATNDFWIKKKDCQVSGNLKLGKARGCTCKLMYF